MPWPGSRRRLLRGSLLGNAWRPSPWHRGRPMLEKRPSTQLLGRQANMRRVRAAMAWRPLPLCAKASVTTLGLKNLQQTPNYHLWAQMPPHFPLPVDRQNQRPPVVAADLTQQPALWPTARQREVARPTGRNWMHRATAYKVSRRHQRGALPVRACHFWAKAVPLWDLAFRVGVQARFKLGRQCGFQTAPVPCHACRWPLQAWLPDVAPRMP